MTAHSPTADAFASSPQSKQETALAHPMIAPYLQHAFEDARALKDKLGDDALRVAVVTTSYDTGFESVEDQVVAKVHELTSAFGLDGPVRWSLWIVDDLPRKAGFSARIEAAFERCAPVLRQQARLRCIPMTSAKPRKHGLKGRALLDGMKAALAERHDAIVYVNLNLKVHAAQVATGLLRMVTGGWDACVGSRATIDGGTVVGAGKAGRAKSIGFNRLVRAAIPVLTRYKDTNAPLKIFGAEAAACIVAQSRIQTVTFDAEWLMILHEHGMSTALFPVIWVQRRGSRPPWTQIPACFMDVVRIRRAWRRYDRT